MVKLWTLKPKQCAERYKNAAGNCRVGDISQLHTKTFILHLFKAPICKIKLILKSASILKCQCSSSWE